MTQHEASVVARRLKSYFVTQQDEICRSIADTEPTSSIGGEAKEPSFLAEIYMVSLSMIAIQMTKWTL